MYYIYPTLVQANYLYIIDARSQKGETTDETHSRVKSLLDYPNWTDEYRTNRIPLSETSYKMYNMYDMPIRHVLQPYSGQYSKHHGGYETGVWSVPNVGDIVIIEDYGSGALCENELPEGKDIDPEAVFGGVSYSLGVFEGHIAYISFSEVTDNTIVMVVFDQTISPDLVPNLYNQKRPYRDYWYIDKEGYVCCYVRFTPYLPETKEYGNTMYNFRTNFKGEDVDWVVNQYDGVYHDLVFGSLNPCQLNLYEFSYKDGKFVHPCGVILEVDELSMRGWKEETSDGWETNEIEENNDPQETIIENETYRRLSLPRMCLKYVDPKTGEKTNIDEMIQVFELIY